MIWRLIYPAKKDEDRIWTYDSIWIPVFQTSALDRLATSPKIKIW
jgi:hypothetical protein